MFGNQPPSLEDALKMLLLKEKQEAKPKSPPASERFTRLTIAGGSPFGGMGELLIPSKKPDPTGPNSRISPAVKPTASSPVLFDVTPNSSFVVPQGKAAPVTWANSFRDPIYDKAEAQAAKELGLDPLYVRMAQTVRVAGERTNNDEVSSAGARSPYQFTPNTRKDFMNKYGIDPWKDPVSGAKAAMLHLKESMDRNNNNIPAAFGEYIGSPDRNRWGSTTRGYINRTTQYLGVPGSPESAGMLPEFKNPFDPARYAPALAEINKAEKAALTPVSITTAMPAAPVMPDLPVAPKRDFTDQDAALAALKPEELDQVEQSRIKRANLFQGLAEGLSRIPDGAGLGLVLAQLGAGALSGRAAGDAELVARQDKFDEKMAQYKIAIFQNETDKGKTRFQEASQEYNALWAHDVAKHNELLQQYYRNNPAPTIAGNNLLTTREDGKGNIVNSVIPIEPMVKASSALFRAQTYIGIADKEYEAARLEANFTNQILTNQFLKASETAAQTSGIGELEALVGSAGVMASTIVRNGMLPQIVGDPEVYKNMIESAGERAQALGSNPGSSEYSEMVMDILQGDVANLLSAPNGKGFQERAARARPVIMDLEVEKRYRDSTRTTKTKTGNTTTTYRE